MSIETLESDRLVIRPICEGDVEAFFRLSQEPSLGRWIPDQVYKDVEEAAKVTRFLMSQYQAPLAPSERPLALAIALKGSGELIGHVGLSPLRGEVEVGYAIAEKYHGNGYASEAVAAVSKWALSRLNLSKILGIVAIENVGSFRVLEKSGYTLEAESEMSYLGRIRLCRKYSFEKHSARTV